MSFLLPIPLPWLALVGGGAALLIGVAYILKMRRQRYEVPFSSLWNRVLKEKESSKLFGNLKRLFSLLLILSLLLLLLFAASSPKWGGDDHAAQHIVVIIDASASMLAMDGDEDGRTRIDAARDKAQDIIDGLGNNDAVMLIRMDHRPIPLSRFEQDHALLRKQISELEASNAPADLFHALSLAQDSLRGREQPHIVLISDGAYPTSELERIRSLTQKNAPESASLTQALDLSQIDFNFHAIGESGENVGIVGFNVRRYITNKLNYEVYIEIENFSAAAVTKQLVLSRDDDVISTEEIRIDENSKITRIIPDLAGEDERPLKATLISLEGDTSKDIFPLDDVAFALLPSHKEQRVLLVSEDNLYLEGALLIVDSLTIDKVTPDDYETAVIDKTLPDYHALVFDGYSPKTVPPTGHRLYFNPEGKESSFISAGKLPQGRVTQLNETHPASRWLNLDDTHFDSLTSFAVNKEKGDVTIASSLKKSVGLARHKNGVKEVVWGFDIASTDMVLRVAFPLLLMNSLDWFAGLSNELFTTQSAGALIALSVPSERADAAIEIAPPKGAAFAASLRQDMVRFYADHVGVYQLQTNTQSEVTTIQSIAVNLSNRLESDVTPNAILDLGQKTDSKMPTSTHSIPFGFWQFLVLAALLILAIEWFTYHRRLTV